MSEIMLNVRDQTRALHTKIHASCVDSLVAALSADAEETIWRISMSCDDPDQPHALAIYGLAAHLAEATEDLKEAGPDHAAIDQLNRDFGNLRESGADPSTALVEPVVARMSEQMRDEQCRLWQGRRAGSRVTPSFPAHRGAREKRS